MTDEKELQELEQRISELRALELRRAQILDAQTRRETDAWLRGLQEEQRRLERESEARHRRWAADLKRMEQQAQIPERPTPMPAWRCFRPAPGRLGVYGVCATMVDDSDSCQRSSACDQCEHGFRNPYHMRIAVNGVEVIAATREPISVGARRQR